jgi:hypothetical protein
MDGPSDLGMLLGNSSVSSSHPYGENDQSCLSNKFMSITGGVGSNTISVFDVLSNRRRCDKSLSNALHEAEPGAKTSSTLQHQGQLSLVQLSNAVPQLRSGNKMHLPPLALGDTSISGRYPLDNGVGAV